MGEERAAARGLNTLSSAPLTRLDVDRVAGRPWRGALIGKESRNGYLAAAQRAMRRGAWGERAAPPISMSLTWGTSQSPSAVRA